MAKNSFNFHTIRNLKIPRISFLLLALLLLLTGCVKNEFHIEVALPDSVTTCTFLYYASDKKQGWLVEKSEHLQKGKVDFLGKTRNPSLVWIFAGGQQPAVAYVERGDRLSLKGKSPDALEWDVRGNDITDRLTDWRLENLKALRSPDHGQLNAAVEKYVKKNPDDPVSSLLLQIYFYRDENGPLFASLWKSLEGDAADPEWVQLVARSDMISGAPVDVASVKSVALTTYPLGCDTLTFSRRPALIYVTRPEAPSYTGDILLLKELLRQYPDSSRRIIAEINVQSDSIGRIRKIDSDTLRGAVRAWMPLGLSDPAAVALGVRSIPAAVVVGPDGKIRYNGSDLRRARDEFKKVAGK